MQLKGGPPINLPWWQNQKYSNLPGFGNPNGDKIYNESGQGSRYAANPNLGGSAGTGPYGGNPIDTSGGVPQSPGVGGGSAYAGGGDTNRTYGGGGSYGGGGGVPVTQGTGGGGSTQYGPVTVQNPTNPSYSSGTQSGRNTSSSSQNSYSMSGPNAQLTGMYANEYQNYLDFHNQNYQNILNSYQGLGQQAIRGGQLGQQQYNQLGQEVQGTIKGIGASQLQSIKDAYAAQSGASNQQLIGAGLGNSTVMQSVGRGNLADEQKAEIQLANSMAGLSAGYQAQLGGAGIGAMQQGYGRAATLGGQFMGTLGGQRLANPGWAPNSSISRGQGVSQSQGFSQGQQNSRGGGGGGGTRTGGGGGGGNQGGGNGGGGNGNGRGGNGGGGGDYYGGGLYGGLPGGQYYGYQPPTEGDPSTGGQYNPYGTFDYSNPGAEDFTGSNNWSRKGSNGMAKTWMPLQQKWV